MQTAIVILCYNNRHFLERFLPGVLRHSEGAEVIIADNASADDTCAWLELHYPELRLIRFEQNLGFCEGYNAALRQVEAAYYLLLNSDIEVTPGWLPPLVRLLDTHPSIAAVQPKLLAFQDRSRFEYAGAAGGYLDALGYPFCRGRLFDHTEQDLAQYDRAQPVFWATGAALLVRAGLYHRFGGLESSFFAHMEEIDFCWRLHRAGYHVYCEPASTVYHVGGGTLNAGSPRKTFLNFRNGIALLLKNMPLSTLLWVLPVRFGLDWLAAVKYLAAKEPGHAKAILRAHGEILGRWGHWQKRRKAARVAGQPSVKVPGLYQGSVVWDFYVRKCRTFKSLDIPDRALFASEVPAQVHQEGQAQVNHHG